MMKTEAEIREAIEDCKSLVTKFMAIGREDDALKVCNAITVMQWAMGDDTYKFAECLKEAHECRIAQGKSLSKEIVQRSAAVN